MGCARDSHISSSLLGHFPPPPSTRQSTEAPPARQSTWLSTNKRTTCQTGHLASTKKHAATDSQLPLRDCCSTRLVFTFKFSDELTFERQPTVASRWQRGLLVAVRPPGLQWHYLAPPGGTVTSWWQAGTEASWCSCQMSTRLMHHLLCSCNNAHCCCIAYPCMHSLPTSGSKRDKAAGADMTRCQIPLSGGGEAASV